MFGWNEVGEVVEASFVCYEGDSVIGRMPGEGDDVAVVISKDPSAYC